MTVWTVEAFRRVGRNLHMTNRAIHRGTMCQCSRSGTGNWQTVLMLSALAVIGAGVACNYGLPYDYIYLSQSFKHTAVKIAYVVLFRILLEHHCV